MNSKVLSPDTYTSNKRKAGETSVEEEPLKLARNDPSSSDNSEHVSRVAVDDNQDENIDYKSITDKLREIYEQRGESTEDLFGEEEKNFNSENGSEETYSPEKPGYKKDENETNGSESPELSSLLQEKLKDVYEKVQDPNWRLPQHIKIILCELNETMSLSILDKFMQSDFGRVRNKSGFLMGIVTNVRRGLVNDEPKDRELSANLLKVVTEELDMLKKEDRLHEDINPIVINSMHDLSEADIRRVLRKFSEVNLKTIMNKSAFFKGIIRRVRHTPPSPENDRKRYLDKYGAQRESATNENEHLNSLTKSIYCRLKDLINNGLISQLDIDSKNIQDLKRLPEFMQIAVISRFMSADFGQIRCVKRFISGIIKKFEIEHRSLLRAYENIKDFQNIPGFFKYGLAPPKPVEDCLSVYTDIDDKKSDKKSKTELEQKDDAEAETNSSVEMNEEASNDEKSNAVMNQNEVEHSNKDEIAEQDGNEENDPEQIDHETPLNETKMLPRIQTHLQVLIDRGIFKWEDIPDDVIGKLNNLSDVVVKTVIEAMLNEDNGKIHDPIIFLSSIITIQESLTKST